MNRTEWLEQLKPGDPVGIASVHPPPYFAASNNPQAGPPVLCFGWVASNDDEGLKVYSEHDDTTDGWPVNRVSGVAPLFAQLDHACLVFILDPTDVVVEQMEGIRRMLGGE